MASGTEKTDSRPTQSRRRPRISFSRTGAKLTGAQLTHTAWLLSGSKFPADYRRFMIKHNGGEPNPAYFSFANPKAGAVELWIDNFLPIDDISLLQVRNTDVFAVLLSLREYIPPEFIPIASVCTYDFLLLCVEERSRACGEIWLLDWDEVAEKIGEISPPNNCLHFVAKSFTDLLASLHDDPEAPTE